MKSSLLFSTCLVLATASANASEWVLTYAFTETRDIASPDGKAAPRHETSAGTRTIALGPTYFAVQEEQKKSIYDFAGDRLVQLSPADATSQNLPLYYLSDFLEAELLNRRMLAAAMRAGKIDQAQNLFSDYDSETSLHLVVHRGPPVPAVKVETRQQGDTTEFLHDGQVVVTFRPDEVPLPREFQHRFENYLSYTCAIHPEIRQAIVATGRIPRELVFHAHYVNTTSVTTLRLIASHPADTDSSVPPANLRPAAPGSSAIEQVLAVVHAALPGQHPARPQALAFIEDALHDNRPLDALLALIEYTLQTGEPITTEMQRYKSIFQTDPACQLYLKALNQSSPAACTQSLALTEKIDRTGIKKPYMLDLQRANLLTLLHRPQEAIPLLLTVLRNNPAHAGALHDLGMILARNYEHALAWTCWDYARDLYPDHPMLRDIAQREQELKSTYPDFF